MTDVPEHLLRRSAEARAQADGRDVEDVLAQMKGEPPPADTPAPPAPSEPAPPPAATPPLAATPPPAAPGAGAAQAGSGRDLQAESAATGVPVHLLERALLARGGTPAAAPTAAVATVEAPAPSAAPAAPPPTAAAVPEGIRTQRLLTVVKARAIQQVKSEPVDKVNVWPHLLAIEFVALLVVTVVLILMSAFIDAPLLELANFNEQPNPSKAPWYFLGLQELLAYFDPMVAGVLIPGMGLVGLAIIPYVDRNPSVRPSDRKLAIMIFTLFVVGASVLTIYGSFFRGPGFNFTFPWRDGIFFDDLKTILE